MQTIDLTALTTVTGGAGGSSFTAPFGGAVTQEIAPITNAPMGTINITNNNAPAAPKPPTTRFEYLRQNPAARFGPPPYKPMPIRPFGR